MHTSIHTYISIAVHMVISLAACPAHHLFQFPHPLILVNLFVYSYSLSVHPLVCPLLFQSVPTSPSPGHLPGYVLLLSLSRHLPRCSVWQRCVFMKVLVFLDDTRLVLAVTRTNCRDGNAEPEQGAGL